MSEYLQGMYIPGEEGEFVECSKCHGRGTVEVSYASAENGPTDDPADEYGVEFCECDEGYRLWKIDCEQNETANAEFFAEMKG